MSSEFNMEDHPYPPPQVCSSAKGKRTKRQKPHSPTPLEVVPDGHAAPTTSNDIMSSTEEEEDMANCLILLAQGQSKPPTSPDHHDNDNNNINKEEDNEQHYYYYPPPPPPPSNHHHHHHHQPMMKYNSKRYLETTATGNKAAGYYVYECKTCNRTFPSFQALGGHRASHKKPKIGGGGGGDHHSQFFPTTTPLQDKNKQLFTLLPSDHTDHDHPATPPHFRKTSSLSLHLSTNNNNGNTSKVHECSICGAEFMSGQALGGHMRRHRSAPNNNIHTTNNAYNNKTPIIVANPNITTLSLTPLIDKLELDQTEEPHPSTEAKAKAKEVLSLDLDLNLPASAQDHQDTTPMPTVDQNNNKLQHIDKKTSQPSSSSSAKVFSASPTLVDCHY